MDLLKDPANDRAVKTLKPPPHRTLDRKLLFPDRLKGKPDWKLLKDHLYREGRLAKEELLKILNDCNKILKNEGNLLFLSDPLTVVGDIHGQYYDLIKLLEVGGNPENTKYLFLGDFVDRGSFSVEVVLLLYCIKINYPTTVYFLRGNHECRQLTSFFNFKDECAYKYDQEIYESFMDSFDNFPLACIVNGKFIALHGGISPELKSLDDIKRLDRYHEPPKMGLFCDILWSDPVDNDHGYLDGGWRGNEVRGCSWFFGNDSASKFLQKNNLISVIRAHEAQLDGYKMHRWNGGQDFPVVITIFSAPNYCDVYNNKGAVIKFENNTLNIQQFNYTQHPYLLPNFMDIFTWSIPFVAEKSLISSQQQYPIVTEMLYHIISHEDCQGDDDDDIQQEDIAKFKNMFGSKKDESSIKINQKFSIEQDVLKKKIKFVTKMMMIQKSLRQQNENIVNPKGGCPDKRINRNLLNSEDTDILSQFTTAKMADSINEQMPNIQVPQPSMKIKKPGQSFKQQQ